MPRPQNKAMLLAFCQKERAALEKFLATLSAEEMTRAGALGEWSVKDVLAHLYAWEQMVLGWLAANQRGETPHIPAEGYKWNQLPALNEQIRQKHQAQPLEKMQAMFAASYEQTMQAIEALDEETLFTPGLYPWMNQNTLGSYFTSCTSSHYRWARTEMRKHRLKKA